MEHPRLPPIGVEDNVGIPEDLRCKRSDGKQWRCNALSMPDKTVCEKHYIQAKKRAANSAMRANLKKAKRKSFGNTDVCSESKYDDPEMSQSMSPMSIGEPQHSGSPPIKKYMETHKKLYSPETMAAKGFIRRTLRPHEEAQMDPLQGEEGQVKSAYNQSPLSKKSFVDGRAGEYSGKSLDSSGEAEEITCHQCRRNDRANVLWCNSCDRKGYCDICISKWYTDIPMEDIQRVCPACRGICSCRVCLSGENMINARVLEIRPIDRLQYLHRLLTFVLPVLKQIYSDQCYEIGVEARVFGFKTDIPRAEIHADDQICCDFCRIPIFDYHRHCTNCQYDLCLTCCRDLRRLSLPSPKGESADHQLVERSKEITSIYKTDDKLSEQESAIDFSLPYPKWKANSDGSIPCAPTEANSCSSSKLVLRRIFKINWVAKLVKNAEEIVNGCKVFTKENCPCTMNAISQFNKSNETKMLACSNRNNVDDNFLYSPTSQDLKIEGICHFNKHWKKGEPVIVKHAFERSLASSWDPRIIIQEIHEMVNDGIMDDNTVLKAIDCFSQSEVDIEFGQFIKGYIDGGKHGDGSPELLKLKDCPSSSALEEFILFQRPEFLLNFPLLEFIHSKLGILNLAAKLPSDTAQTELGPKLFISYGVNEELGGGDSVANLQISMSDLVYVLMHSSELSIQADGRTSKESNASYDRESNYILKVTENTKLPDLALDECKSHNTSGSGVCSEEEKIVDKLAPGGNEIGSCGTGDHNLCLSDEDTNDVSGKLHSGATWDVFRRQDVSKLNDYLRAHWSELSSSSKPVKHPVYEQAFFLNKGHKRKLKEEFGIEPWTFQQHVAEAIFIPAGCPFQVRNLQSSVQVALSFLSPESLRESIRLSQEIRCLPNDHDAKLKMLEVRRLTFSEKVAKISLYAASSAIRDIQKIILDPKLGSEIKFEDRNLTALVAENLESVTKGRPIVCT